MCGLNKEKCLDIPWDINGTSRLIIGDDRLHQLGIQLKKLLY